ncbi:hypothetical protein HDU85_006977 [Gaertneriomyces sp. JEL0708]|nr:hypothetical protein HDU85_006977 [Gaertneriomyces sp. JEL0708]
MSAIYLRLKRHKTTWFVEAKPTDTVQTLKNHLLPQLPSQSTTTIQIQIPTTSKTASDVPQYAPLDDSAVLEQIGIVDDSVLYVVFNEGDGWEPVEVPEFEPLDDDAEDE